MGDVAIVAVAAAAIADGLSVIRTRIGDKTPIALLNGAATWPPTRNKLRLNVFKN